MIKSRAGLSSVKVLNFAVGIPCLIMKSLEKALLASIRAALALGPKQLIPADVIAETDIYHGTTMFQSTTNIKSCKKAFRRESEAEETHEERQRGQRDWEEGRGENKRWS